MFWHRSRAERLFLFLAHAPAIRFGRSEVEKPDPDFPFAAALDLLDPTLWRFGARQAAPKTSDIEIDWFAKRVVGQFEKSRG